MCKKIQTAFRCAKCNAEIPAERPVQSLFSWMTCPEYRLSRLADPEQCSVADWEPARPPAVDLDEPHGECKVWWNRRRRPRPRETLEEGEARRDPLPGSREESEGEAMRGEWLRYLGRRSSRFWDPVCSR